MYTSIWPEKTRIEQLERAHWLRLVDADGAYVQAYYPTHAGLRGLADAIYAYLDGLEEADLAEARKQEAEEEAVAMLPMVA